MLTFATGGTLAETTSSLSFQPNQRSPGQGYWEYTGRRTFLARKRTQASRQVRLGTTCIDIGGVCHGVRSDGVGFEMRAPGHGS